ncbi:MAG: HAD-IC family P-type ATPase, partial [Lactobacillales bacterium]|nr:HAD-IC family P-type ATPase [Lactobacillales bacterium]
MKQTLWHHLNNTQILEYFAVDPNKGMTDTQITKSRNAHGFNEMSPKKGKSALLRLWLQIHQPLIYVLIVSATIALYLEEYIDAAVIYGVVIGNAAMGFIQESKALKALDSLSKSITVQAHVIRNGESTQIDAKELVPGDVVLLHSGEKVPADLRLIHAHDLKIDESALTGESVPVMKDTHAMAQETALADRKNMAYAGSLITYGLARAIVVETGDKTQIGKISKLIHETVDLKTPLTEKIEAFSAKLLWLIVFLSVLAFGVGYLKNMPFVDTFMSAIAMAIAAIPEGLPAALTIILAIGVNRMSKRKAIVRKLPAVETLGSTSIICSDKTGTLTENKMTVQKIVAGGREYDVSGIGYVTTGDFSPREENTALVTCLKTGVLCNEAQLKEKNPEGDPTEIALLVAAAKKGMIAKNMNAENARLYEIPFESDYQYMATLHQDQTMYVKGAVEAILPFCSAEMDSKGKSIPVNRKDILDRMEKLAREGKRVLGFAIKNNMEKDKITHADVQTGLIFVGLQAMIDPPRPEAIRAIKACHSAGISVKMITGDHLVTAKAIAMQMDLHGSCDTYDPVVMNGTEISKKSDAELRRIAPGID